MNPIESLKVDNAPKALNTFAVPEMSLSSGRATMNRSIFEFTIRADALVEFLEPAYLAWIAESKKDDEQCGGPQDALAVAGYPPLSQLVENPPLLELVIGHYLLQEFLGELTWDRCSAIEYWLDTVTSCRLEHGLIHLSGICYSQKNCEA
jgi:hypothetical protein